MIGLLHDLRYAIRLLAKSPGFTCVAVLILALGIGANTAIFSLINGLMFRTSPVRDPGSLVELLHRSPGGEPAHNGFSWDAYQLIRQHNHVLSDLIVDSPDNFVVSGKALEPHRILGGYLGGDFFAALGVLPATGRLLGPEADDLSHPSPVAVISWSYWKGKLNSDPAVLGKQIIVNDTPITIIGVAQQGFGGLNEEMAQDIWLPISMKPVIYQGSALGWGSLGLSLIGRLKPGVSLAEASAELSVLFQSAIRAPGVGPYVREMKFELQPASSGMSSELRQMLRTPALVLMAIVSLILLIACANLAGLLLARGASRRHEMAVRTCLGASRVRLFRQALTESLLLSILGALLGIYLANSAGPLLLHTITSGRAVLGLPVHLDALVRPDWHVLSFTATVALLTALLFGALPALGLSALPSSALQPATRASDSRSRRLFGKSLIVAQVAASITLLSVAALFVSYVSNLRNRDLGFRRDHLLLVSLDPYHSSYDAPQWSHLSQELLAHLQALPGVRSATFSAMTPMKGTGASSFATAQGRPDLHLPIAINYVGPSYFETYGTPFVAGRDFSFRAEHGPLVAIINQSMAREFFGDRSPIGTHMTLDHITLRGDDTPTYQIVGVVGDAKYNDLQQAPPRTIYLQAFQAESLTVRTAINPSAVSTSVRQTIASVMPTLPITGVTTMTDQIDAAIVPERLIATLSTWFGALAALLTAIGLYGLLAYTVAHRTNEIGVRMALGASPGDILRLVLRDALLMLCIGVALGIPLALWSKRIAVHLLEGLPTTSSSPVILGVLLIAAVALLAAFIPAHRATRADPNIALRYE